MCESCMLLRLLALESYRQMQPWCRSDPSITLFEEVHSALYIPSQIAMAMAATRTILIAELLSCGCHVAKWSTWEPKSWMYKE